MLSKKLRSVRENKKTIGNITPVFFNCFKKLGKEDVPPLRDTIEAIEQELHDRIEGNRDIAEVRMREILEGSDDNYIPVTFFEADKPNEFITKIRDISIRDLRIVKNRILEIIEEIESGDFNDFLVD